MSEFLVAKRVETSDTGAAAALGALGIPMDRNAPWIAATGARESVTYFFEKVSVCGQIHTGEMLRAWDDREWHAANPRHPLAYLRVYFRNVHRYRDMRAGAKLAAAWRSGRMELLTVDRPDFRPRSEPLPLKPDGLGIVETDDECLSAALCAVGVPLFTAQPWRFEGGIVFRHHATSPDGRFRAAELALGWQSATWWALHPEHPFSYLVCGARNCEFLTARVRGKAPLVVMHSGIDIGMIPADASSEMQATFFKRFKA